MWSAYTFGPTVRKTDILAKEVKIFGLSREDAEIWNKMECVVITMVAFCLNIVCVCVSV